jgi:regulator of RNase E activity RraA
MSSFPFRSKWPGRCACCGQDIKPGDDVVYDENKIVLADPDHADDYAPDSDWAAAQNTRKIEVMPRGKSAADRCGRCFLVHSSNQTECE